MENEELKISRKCFEKEKPRVENFLLKPEGLDLGAMKFKHLTLLSFLFFDKLIIIKYF